MEQQQLKDRLDRELEILMAYQSKNKLNAEKQRSKERHELEDRVRVRRSLLEKKVCGCLAFVEVVGGSAIALFADFKTMFAVCDNLVCP